jgi:hypothetical protein
MQGLSSSKESFALFSWQKVYNSLGPAPLCLDLPAPSALDLPIAHRTPINQVRVSFSPQQND